MCVGWFQQGGPKVLWCNLYATQTKMEDTEVTVHCGSVSDSGCERKDQKRLKAARRNTLKKLLKLVIFVYLWFVDERMDMSLWHKLNGHKARRANKKEKKKQLKKPQHN